MKKYTRKCGLGIDDLHIISFKLRVTGTMIHSLKNVLCFGLLLEIADSYVDMNLLKF